MLPDSVKYQRPLVEIGRVVPESSAQDTDPGVGGADLCHYNNRVLKVNSTSILF